MTLIGRTAVVTGVGYRGGGPVTDPLATDKSVKLNIGCATAARLAERGARVLLIGRSLDKVKRIGASLDARWPGAVIGADACDATDKGNIDAVLGPHRLEGPVLLVQNVGLSSGFYSMPNDNPYDLIGDVTIERALEETRVPLAAFLAGLHSFLPIWRGAGGGRFVVVNSMSAIRAYARGGSHATAKGALHQAIRSAALELYKEGIYLTEINPGIVDTGLYDNPIVSDAVRDIALSCGQDLCGQPLPMMSPYDVADAIVLALESAAHILQINLVAEGQFPQLGA
jgi:NAD(P)-dependent dehydrogenase (short-subunit alcohol dehydrogenase family)